MATYTGSPNVLARSVGATPEPDSCAERVFAGAVPTSAFLLATSHPRTCTSLTCSAEVTTARKRRGRCPGAGAAGSACSLFGAGASVAGFGARNSNLPSLTATSCPISRASPSRNSQSVDPALAEVVEDRGRRVDRAEREPGALGDLLRDVRRGDLRVGLRAPAAEEPVRGVEPADHGERPGGVELHLQRRDLGGDQRLRRGRPPARRGDHELGPDLHARLGQHGAVRVAEPQDHQVGQVEAVVDDARTPAAARGRPAAACRRQSP